MQPNKNLSATEACSDAISSAKGTETGPASGDTRPAGDGTDPETSSQTANTSKGPENASSTVEKLDPTRYGDWEKNGRCIDF